MELSYRGQAQAGHLPHQLPAAAVAAAGAASYHPPFSQQNGFLPGFLMGDYAQCSGQPIVSPNTGMTSPTSQGLGQGPAPRAGMSFVGSTNNGMSHAEKPVGPPVTGLFATQSGPSSRNSINSSYGSHGYCSVGHNGSAMPNTALGLNADEKKESDDGCWVTVFGFPPSSLNFILSQFSQCGSILAHKSSTNGNWVHLKYQTKMQAQRAIGRSGRVLSGTLMIGVVECTDTELTGLTKNLFVDTTVFQGLNPNPIGHEYVLNNSLSPQKSTHQPKQPLVKPAEFNTSNKYGGVILNAPSKNEGIVGKALELIFGW